MVPSTVVWPSSMHSSSADCVLGEARLISSPMTMLLNTGPGRNSNSWLPVRKMLTPVRSLGSRSGVNWMRPHVAVDAAGDRLGERRLADAGHVLDQQVALGQQDGERDVGQPWPARHDRLDRSADASHGFHQLVERARSGRCLWGGRRR